MRAAAVVFALMLQVPPLVFAIDEADSDNDGASNAQEISEGYDPNNPNSYPPRFVMVKNHAASQFLYGDSSCQWNYYSAHDLWGAGINLWSSGLDYPCEFPSLSGYLDEDVPLPATIPGAPLQYTLAQLPLSVGGESVIYGPLYGADLEHAAVWLQVSPAPTQEIKRTVFKVTEMEARGTPSGSNIEEGPYRSKSVEALTFTIPASTATPPIPLQPVTSGNAKKLLPSFFYNPAPGYLFLFKETVKVSLLPVELTVFKRGTIQNPGPAVPRPPESQVYEVVTLENADYDETTWQPTTMADGANENMQDGKTDVVSTTLDDDFVKLRFKCPIPITVGSSEIVFDQAGQGERMLADDIRFYTSDGQRVLLADLKLPSLGIRTGPLAPAFGSGGLELFAEIRDLGEITDESTEADDTTRKYADVIWKISTGGTTIEQKLRIYRGGFWRCDRTDNTGTIALYDGKGRKPDGTVDYGQIVKGPYQILTGRKRDGVWVVDETVSKYGPTPMGWYGLWARNTGNNNTDMRTEWSTDGRPQTNHDLNASDDSLGYVQQGSYCQWAAPGNYIIPGKGPYGYDNGNDSDPYQGMPASIHFKFELLEIGEFTSRTFLQIHPDGFCDGTAGCLGIQTYSDCCNVLFLVRHYFQTRLIVD